MWWDSVKFRFHICRFRHFWISVSEKKIVFVLNMLTSFFFFFAIIPEEDNYCLPQICATLGIVSMGKWPEVYGRMCVHCERKGPFCSRFLGICSFVLSSRMSRGYRVVSAAFSALAACGAQGCFFSLLTVVSSWFRSRIDRLWPESQIFLLPIFQWAASSKWFSLFLKKIWLKYNWNRNNISWHQEIMEFRCYCS